MPHWASSPHHLLRMVNRYANEQHNSRLRRSWNSLGLVSFLWYSVMHPGPIDRAANTLEYFVHHEDVRRAIDGWEP